MKHCINCGADVNRNGLRCTECANLHKARLANEKADRRMGVKQRTIKLKNGLEVLNNCFGQVMATADKVWFCNNG